MDKNALFASWFIFPLSRAAVTSGRKFFGRTNGSGKGSESSAVLEMALGSALSMYLHGALLVDAEVSSSLSKAELNFFFLHGMKRSLSSSSLRNKLYY